MKKYPKISFGLLFILGTSLVFSHSIEAQGRKLFKDGEIIESPTPIAQQTPARSVYFNEESLQKNLDTEQKVNDSNGWPPSTLSTSSRNKGENLDYFELPPEESIPGCTYTSGFSFPDFCTDEQNNVIFEAGKHPQSVLDELEATHKIKSVHNVIPQSWMQKLKEQADQKAIRVIPHEIQNLTPEERYQKAMNESANTVDSADGL